VPSRGRSLHRSRPPRTMAALQRGCTLNRRSIRSQPGSSSAISNSREPVGRPRMIFGMDSEALVLAAPLGIVVAVYDLPQMKKRRLVVDEQQATKQLSTPDWVDGLDEQGVYLGLRGGRCRARTCDLRLVRAALCASELSARARHVTGDVATRARAARCVPPRQAGARPSARGAALLVTPAHLVCGDQRGPPPARCVGAPHRAGASAVRSSSARQADWGTSWPHSS
jgi:hypothetical protein